MDITHDNVCSSMLSCFYSHLLSTGRPISSCFLDLPSLNVTAHLFVPAGWGSCLSRMAIFLSFQE